jgi:hypothetical protein
VHTCEQSAALLAIRLLSSDTAAEYRWLVCAQERAWTCACLQLERVHEDKQFDCWRHCGVSMSICVATCVMCMYDTGCSGMA